MKKESLICYFFAACSVAVTFFLTGCQPSYSPGSFGYDVAFLSEYQDAIVLEEGKARVLVSTKYQGRVMTSSAEGMGGNSFGWMNYDLIKSGEFAPHISPFGGEDRFWLGPEGGQFSIYFAPGKPFEFEDWFVPKEIDSEPFDLVSHTPTEAIFTKEMRLQNYSGTNFDLKVDRSIRILDDEKIMYMLGMLPVGGVKSVGFVSDNILTNTGDSAWTQSTGMLSIWILGMFKPSPATTIIIPFRPGPDSLLGPIVNDAYFGKVPEDRLVQADSILFFKGDGAFRSKIGLTPHRAKPVSGSYDAAQQVLTLVFYSLDPSRTDYVNSMWEMQEKPFAGDAVNSYNDGPLDDGGQLGPFYELESSSPAAALGSGESLTHVHTTIHLTGKEAGLDKICKELLGVGLEEIKGVF